MDQRYDEKFLFNEGGERRNRCTRQEKNLSGVRVEMKSRMEGGAEK